ncbi:MAG: hypothetical protein ABIG30_01395 [Candidatus Aenigmatarchaeota archaeon]
MKLNGKLTPYLDALEQAWERGDLDEAHNMLIAMADVAEAHGCNVRAEHYRKLASAVPDEIAELA